MEIVDLRIMRGPNYWSVKNPKIIVLRLDLENYKDTLTNEIPDFSVRLEKLFPGLSDHRSTEGAENRFFESVRKGVRLSHVVERIALELQNLSSMGCGYGLTYPLPQEGINYVVFAYSEERAGEYAAYAAVKITEALVKDTKYNVKRDIERLHEIREDEHIGPSTYSIVTEAVSRGIPYMRLNKNSLIQLGYGVNQRRIQATMTRGGMLRSGLGFDYCDVGIVTNVAADHLGLRDINTVEEMAQVKAVISKSVRQNGYAGLNADDDLVYKMSKDLDCNVALFSLDENNPRILRHTARGGLAVVLKNGYIPIFKNSYKIRVDRVADIPLTFGGRAKFNIENVLAATLAAYVSRIPVEDIKLALRTFIPSAAKTPGRMNVFRFSNFEVIVDYAHNAAGLQAIGGFIRTTDATRRVGIIAGVGDRRNEDTRELGSLAAEYFDEIIIRQDKDLRGASLEHINNNLLAGIHQMNPDKQVVIIPDEMRAIAHALENAERGDLIIIFFEDISEAIKLVENFRFIQDRRVLVD